MADVGHAGSDEDLLNRIPSHFAEQLHVVWIVRAGHHRFGELVEVDVEHFGVVSISVSREQLRVGQPGFHFLDPSRQGAGIAVTPGDHVFQQGHVAAQVFADRFFGELDRTACAGAFGTGIREFKGLFELQVGEPFDLHDSAVEQIFFVGFFNGQQASLNRDPGNGIDDIAKGDSRLQRAAEAHQHRLGHVQRHGADGRGEGHEAGSSGEGDAQWEAGMAVSAGAHRVGQQHAVEPAVDDSVSGAQGHSAPLREEIGKVLLGLQINGLGVSRGVAEALHHEVG